MWLLNINAYNFDNLYILIIITNFSLCTFLLLSIVLPLPFVHQSNFEKAYKIAEIDEIDENEE